MFHYFVTLHHYSDTWWGDDDARVICRMLGLDTLVGIATLNSKYGDVGDDYILSYAECRGTEDDIGQCKQTTNPSCYSGNAAGVMCIPPGPTNDIPIELVDGSNNTEGHVKIFGQPIW